MAPSRTGRARPFKGRALQGFAGTRRVHSRQAKPKEAKGRPGNYRSWPSWAIMAAALTGMGLDIPTRPQESVSRQCLGAIRRQWLKQPLSTTDDATLDRMVRGRLPRLCADLPCCACIDCIVCGRWTRCFSEAARGFPGADHHPMPRCPRHLPSIQHPSG
ncbi:hypothetical protein B0J15DRAFT_266333 [Fusarium solani]|uniref:Uncharacterized protein n=1 Tax=Fusarium solani TaxID=169388 RepID=A0A9P9HVS1_FUSSL|nr:uncharacterized protein B0J15DRAFT_266333 [Fusarium solani]KAH7264212.1 hypothetical protein B0J15DRAFT_266333 [Fusarium solani]